MINFYENPLTEPDLSEWQKLMYAHFEGVKGNQLSSGKASSERLTARRRLIDSAQSFVLRLHEMMQRAGLPALSTPVLTGQAEKQPLVMTGHQPVIFHSGLTFKYETTEAFAAGHSAICVAVVIDTDEGDCGQFAVPQLTGSFPDNPDELPHIQQVIESVAQSSGLFLTSQLKNSEEIRHIAAQTADRLSSLNLPDEARDAQQRLQQYAQLSDAGATAMEASLIMRWQHGIGPRMLELPLSAICCFPETLAEIANILTRFEEFSELYNRLLHRFRTEQKIENAANPFPSLEVNADSAELPFWMLDTSAGRRETVRGKVLNGQLQLISEGLQPILLPLPVTSESLENLLLQNRQLIPRGALITALLRVLFCDLFVHGTGGGKYDRMTNLLIEDWWQSTPSPFSVASASGYLFADARRKLIGLEELAKQLRDLQFNPQRHLGTQIFPAELEGRLQVLIREKQDAVARMKSAHAENQSAKAVGLEIQQLTNRIRDEVSAAFENRLTALRSLSAEEKAAINSRTYAWILFSSASKNS